jgi:Phosphotransferase system, mannose/fructose/N-acetylgalactosamine-specific component IID
MTIIQALLIAVFYFLANSPWPAGGLGNYATVYRPMVAGLVVGIILGDPVTGTMIGATINLMYVGFISAGGSMPADMSLAGILGTALAITSGIDADAALAIAVPLGLLGSIVWVGRLTLDSAFVRLADRYVEEGKPEKVWIANILLPQALLFLITAVPCFLAAYFGANYISGLIASLGGNFLRILAVIGGMLPAIGIGMMLLSIFKGPARIFFFLGFIVSAYLGLGILPLALIFLCISLLYVGGKEGFKIKNETAEEAAADAQTGKLLSKKDLRRAWWNWMYYFQSCYNYERMQGVGFLHAMSPVIKKVYKGDPEGTKDAMRRHVEFFNTENATGSAVIGLVAAMEEQKKNGAELDDEAFTSIKTGLMGPLAGIGDTLWQGVVIPLLLAMFLGLSREGNVAAPIIYVIVFFLLYYGFGYWLLMLGYNKGRNAILNLMESGIMKKVITAAGVLGCAVMGALVSNYVSLNCIVEIPQGEAVFSLQNSLFDAILPGLLPLLLTLGCYKLLKKGVPGYLLLLIVVALGVVGGLVGIF